MRNKLKLVALSGLTIYSGLLFAEHDRKHDVSKVDNSLEKIESFIKSDDIWIENQENPLSQFYIAEQKLLSEDYSESLNWYLKSANQGFEPAIKNAILLIDKDKGVKDNMDEVVDFLSKRGINSDTYSEMYLGDVYRSGKYQKDYEKSYFWYSEAAKKGIDKAKYYVGNMSISGVGTFQNVPKGLRLLKEVAETGHANAMHIIGKVFKTGYNIQKNHIEASNWFLKSAKEGHVKSMFEIADNYERGLGLEKSDKKALEWFENAALHGHTEAAYRAGMLHLYLSVEGDEFYTVDKAVEWLQVASDENNVDAQLRLGDIYYEGKYDVPRDYVLSEKYYKLSSENGSKIAYKKISMIYRLGGFGVERDKEKYKDAIKKFYTFDESKKTSIDDKLELFDYSLFKY